MNGHASASKGPGLGSPCFSLGVGATVYTRRSCVEISVTRCGVQCPGHLARKVNPVFLFWPFQGAVAISGSNIDFNLISGYPKYFSGIVMNASQWPVTRAQAGSPCGIQNSFGRSVLPSLRYTTPLSRCSVMRLTLSRADEIQNIVVDIELRWEEDSSPSRSFTIFGG